MGCHAGPSFEEPIQEPGNIRGLYPDLAAYHQAFRMRTKMGLELTNCLEIHTLELPKYPKGDDNSKSTDPLDQWMDFFRNAVGSSPEHLRQRFLSEVFDEAIGVLEMISRTPEQRRYYNARLKWELDENTRRAAEEAARAESEARGEQKGKAEQIRLLQGLLGETPTDMETLKSMAIIALDAVFSELQSKLRSRLS